MDTIIDASAWVTRPERPNFTKDEVKRPDGPPARSLLVKDIGDKLADRDLFPAIKREASRGDSHLSCSSLAAVDLKRYCNISQIFTTTLYPKFG